MMTNDMTTDLHNLDMPVTTLENTSSSIKESLARIEGRFDKVDQEIKDLRNEIKEDIKETRQEVTEVRKELKNDIRTNFFWSLGAFIGVVGLMAHAFKWI